jgi:hypothetical protein
MAENTPSWLRNGGEIGSTNELVSKKYVIENVLLFNISLMLRVRDHRHKMMRQTPRPHLG